MMYYQKRDYKIIYATEKYVIFFKNERVTTLIIFVLYHSSTHFAMIKRRTCKIPTEINSGKIPKDIYSFIRAAETTEPSELFTSRMWHTLTEPRNRSEEKMIYSVLSSLPIFDSPSVSVIPVISSACSFIISSTRCRSITSRDDMAGIFSIVVSQRYSERGCRMVSL